MITHSLKFYGFAAMNLSISREFQWISKFTGTTLTSSSPSKLLSSLESLEFSVPQDR
jgi:hypothetical protein